ncbi:MAG: glycosyltransferase family 2 protein [Eubacterium ventriosum]
MKLLTITIPCYNSQDYMEKSICSALTGGDRVEIIIVDDGSSDNTLQIAKKYRRKVS